MKRFLENKFYKYRAEENRKALEKTNKLSKRERRNYYCQLNLNNITEILQNITKGFGIP